ncbi:Uncharacterized protein Fot_29888 [Forsythia ovata]|uniref:Uncharacterized protein n=1 Tax=Forsythia ovata TaxID=205694 RepID=A0ABD1TT59_9LAMI
MELNQSTIAKSTTVNQPTTAKSTTMKIYGIEPWSKTQEGPPQERYKICATVVNLKSARLHRCYKRAHPVAQILDLHTCWHIRSKIYELIGLADPIYMQARQICA